MKNLTSQPCQLIVRLDNGVKRGTSRFDYGCVDEAVSAIHAVAKKHGYACLVDYDGDEPMLSWKLVRMQDNRTCGNAYIR